MKQATLFEVEQAIAPKESWCTDDWETPDPVAKFMASLLTPDEWLVVEPAAGTGQIAKYLPEESICMELNPLLCEVGKISAPHCDWVCADWLEPSMGRIDCIIGNPPFSLGTEFLQASANRLNKHNPEARILFLLPSEYFQSQARAAALQSTGLVITHQWAIVGRVGYLKQGKVFNQRQCYDSVFELRLCGNPSVEIVDPYGKL